MREGGSCEAGGGIALEGVSAGAFRVLLRYLYTQELPEAEDCGEGLAVGEMAKAADYFQAVELFEHCVEQFKGGLRVGNVMERLVQAHDMKLEALEEAAMQYQKAHALSFQVSACFCVCPCFLVVRECMKIRIDVVYVDLFFVTEGRHGDVGSAQCAT